MSKYAAWIRNQIFVDIFSFSVGMRSTNWKEFFFPFSSIFSLSACEDIAEGFFEICGKLLKHAIGRRRGKSEFKFRLQLGLVIKSWKEASKRLTVWRRFMSLLSDIQADVLWVSLLSFFSCFFSFFKSNRIRTKKTTNFRKFYCPS